MTRQEFVDGILDWGDLLSFCREYGYDCYVEDIYDSYTIRDEFIDSDIRDIIDYESWEFLRDCLDDVDLSGDYYEYRNRLEYYCVDDDFDDYCEDVLRACDDDLFFESEEDEEEDEEDEEQDIDNIDPVTGELLDVPICQDPSILYRQGFNRPCDSAITRGLVISIGEAEQCAEKEQLNMSFEQLFA